LVRAILPRIAALAAEPQAVGRAGVSEIHMFLGSGKAGDENQFGYRTGALLIFLAQPEGSEHDWSAAETLVTDAGWHEIHLTKAGTVLPDNVPGNSEEVVAAFGDALERGGSVLVYSDTVELPA
jgi:hypothetical protein